MLENARYPHVKRGWIRAIKTIRSGAVSEEGYVWRNVHEDMVPSVNVRGLLRKADDGYIKHPDPGHWLGVIRGAAMPTFRICKQWMQTSSNLRQNKDGELPQHEFSDSSSSDRLTEEQENEIAENIYDWWISGKSYKRWYAEKFQQMKLTFGET